VTSAVADAHLHLFRNGFPATRGGPVIADKSEVETYEALRRTHGIAAGLVVGYVANDIDPENNRYIRELATERPWMATLAYLPLHPAPAAENIETFFADGHAGLAVYLPDTAAAEALASWPVRAWRAVEDRAAILSLNARPDAVRELSETVRRRSGCRFLFAHLGLPGRHATVPSAPEAAARLRPMLDLADCPNAYVKISGLYAVSDPPEAHPHEAAKPFVELLLDRLGAARCLWGSDFSPALEFVSFAETLAIPCLDRLGPEEQEQVMGRNLLRLLARGGQS
jgi:predicted TIM-barrel fold metal-dependent hydrolase